MQTVGWYIKRKQPSGSDNPKGKVAGQVFIREHLYGC